MKVVFNADDFGYSKAVNYGIIEAFKSGVVRSTSILVTTPYFDHAVNLYNEYKDLGLGVGIHLNLMMGKPLCDGLDTLVDANGNFYKHMLFDSSKNFFDNDEMITEFTAQIEKALAAGIKLTHIDSHYGVHMQDPLFSVACTLAKKYDLPLRMIDVIRDRACAQGIRTAQKFTGGFFAQNTTVDYLKGYFESIDAESVEVLCRPAYIDEAIYNGSRYSLNRMKEIEVLCSDEVKELISNLDIELVNYSQIDYVVNNAESVKK